MIRINPIKITNTKPISFKNEKPEETKTNASILSLQAPSAHTKFETRQDSKPHRDSKKANPIVAAISHRFAKTYNVLVNPPENKPEPKLDGPAGNPFYTISFLG